MATDTSKPRSAASYLAWARLWARYIDITIYTFIASLVVGATYPAIANLNQAVIGILLLPVGLFIDALVLGAFGTSIGKAIAGVRIASVDESKLKPAVHFKRELRIWGALGLGIPIVALFTLQNSYNELKFNGATGWDSETSTRAVSVNSSSARTYLAAIVYFFMAFGIYSIAYWAEHTHVPSESSVSGATADVPAPIPVRTRAQELQDSAKDLNSKAPMKIDELTTLERVESGENDLTYYYSLKTTRSRFAVFHEKLRQNLLRQYCKKDSLGDSGVRAVYDYSVGTAHLGSFSFQPDQCATAAPSGEPTSAE